MNQRPIDMIHQKGTTGAPFLPTWSKHKMIYDQLAPPFEKVGKLLLTLWPIKDIILFDLDPGQLAALPADFIPLPCKLFLPGQKRFARLDPFLSRDDMVI